MGILTLCKTTTLEISVSPQIISLYRRSRLQNYKSHDRKVPNRADDPDPALVVAQNLQESHSNK